jgi:hypothetical protein
MKRSVFSHRTSLQRAIQVLPLLLAVLVANVIGQAQTAERKYRNIQVLKGVPAKNVDSIMRAFNRALAVECAFCHVQDKWEDESKPQFATARKMFQMVKVLNENQLAKTSGVSCWTCHAGQTKPSRLPHPLLDAEEAKWPTALTNTSERVKLAMSIYNATLNVGCNYCHVPTDWKSNVKSAYKMVARMNSMFTVFPQYMPSTARTQCWMCHKGSTEPKRRKPF